MTNKISYEEYLMLKDIIKKNSDEELLKEYIEYYRVEEQLKAIDKIDLEKAWTSYMEKRSKRQKTRKMYRFAAAASIAAIFIASLWITFDPFGKEIPLAEQYPDMGKQEAILTVNSPAIIDPTIGHSSVDHPNKFVLNSILNLQNIDNSKILPTDTSFIDVPYGCEYKLILSDGTSINLNSGSTLKFPTFFTENRTVELTGEAFFSVTKNEKMPFSVITKNARINVLGTEFNVSNYNAEPTVVTLVEGKVQVDSESAVEFLDPGMQATIQYPNQIETSNVEVRLYTSWVEGSFEFNKMNLKNIATKISRWYDVEIEFEDKELENIEFTGAILRNKPLGYSLDIIQKIANVKFKRENNLITISHK